MKAATLLLLLILSATAVADQPSISAASQAAARGDYRSAVRNYQGVLEEQGFSSPVLFNLGNAWLRAGQPARAILAYERALVLTPDRAAIATNLAAAQQRAGLAPEVVGPWVGAVRYFSFDTYVWAGLAAVWVLCVALVLVCFNGIARRIARPAILVAVVTLCVCADAVVLQWPDLHRAVVLTQGELHLAPAQSAAASGSVREGEVVWLQERYVGFDFVRTADGRTGWISDEAAAAVRVNHP